MQCIKYNIEGMIWSGVYNYIYKKMLSIEDKDRLFQLNKIENSGLNKLES